MAEDALATGDGSAWQPLLAEDVPVPSDDDDFEAQDDAMCEADAAAGLASTSSCHLPLLGEVAPALTAALNMPTDTPAARMRRLLAIRAAEQAPAERAAGVAGASSGYHFSAPPQGLQ